MSWNIPLYKKQSDTSCHMSLSTCSDLKTQINDFSSNSENNNNNNNVPRRKVSFGQIEYIKVQSYKNLNKQCRISEIILTTEETECECNCIIL